MPIAKKMPSGSWSCVVTVGYEDGKRIQKRVTVKDPSRSGKKKCEQLAIQLSVEARTKPSATVSECVHRYIKSKEKILSPNTICGYRQLERNAYESISDKEASSINAYDLQTWMTGFAENHSAKSCANAKGLLIASLNMECPEIRYHVTLPQTTPYDYYSPTDEDVLTLLRLSDGELKKAILLAAFGTLRRGEICALTENDLKDDAVHVSKSIATNPDGGYSVKQPKTASSVRTVPLPKSVIRQLTPTNGKIVDLTLKGLSKRFETVMQKAVSEGMHPFRFHDLRAYSISARHAMGIPDQYVIGTSGHSTDTVMKRVYRREMADKKREFDRMANEHFDAVVKRAQSQKSVTTNRLIRLETSDANRQKISIDATVTTA